jgi:hypothetical protein
MNNGDIAAIIFRLYTSSQVNVYKQLDNHYTSAGLRYDNAYV